MSLKRNVLPVTVEARGARMHRQRQGIVMRTWRFAAGAAAMIMTHAAPAWAEAVVPTGLSGIADAGGVLGVTAQPGTQLAHNFRLRVAMAASSPIDPASDRLPRPHRIGSMIDYYPAGVSGLHFSAGVRALSNRIRGASNAFLSPADSALYTPKAGGPLVNHSGLRKASPAATLGWTTAFSPTDTMPLSPRSKLLMALEALVSLMTVGLVAARAVNILN